MVLVPDFYNKRLTYTQNLDIQMNALEQVLRLQDEARWTLYEKICFRFLYPAERKAHINAYMAYCANILMSQLEIDVIQLPRVRFDNLYLAAYDNGLEEITVSDEISLFDIPMSIAEEVGHFFRIRLQPEGESSYLAQEMNTHEFFGFLTRKIVLAAMPDSLQQQLKKESPQSRVQCGDIDPSLKLNELKDLKGEIKNVTTQLAKMAQVDFSQLSFRKKIEHSHQVGLLFAAEEQLIHDRFQVISHVRGYQYASETDLDQIQDMRALFELPAKEVRMRFFRENKQY